MSLLPRVAILLPTYNGARYLTQQLDSLLQQDADEFIIVTRDDGSTDNTTEIIAHYQSDFPEQFHVVENRGQNLGASGNFSLLMEYVLDNKEALDLPQAYLLLCDQDDIWLPGKIRHQLQAMVKLEAQQPGRPLLVHSDLKVIDADQAEIAPSFLRYQGLDGTRTQLRQIVFSNTVTGCTALLNEPLVRLALPVPDTAIMHDWWLALVAAAFGTIAFDDRVLVLYRQHEQNTIGAQEYQPRPRFSRTTVRELFQSGPNAALYAVAAQAQAFLDRYSRELPRKEQRRLKLVRGLRSNSVFVQRVLFRLLRV